MYGLSLTEAYTIKLAGTVELGNQLSKVIKEMYQELAQEGYLPDAIETVKEGGPALTGEADLFDYIKLQKEIADHKAAAADNNMPILDKMMKNDLEKLHLYGFHKVEGRGNGEPLNNINI
ncbi:unnamed protein product [Chrysodeixis includens]|uniref:Uncharacterized protein n=1 Tax=Chrysodeixis includens TaxID=689277 RepID=A0A9N8L3Z4_CHRIL|nr:unnamed protein product [Chrysodeixis includens]